MSAPLTSPLGRLKGEHRGAIRAATCKVSRPVYHVSKGCMVHSGGTGGAYPRGRGTGQHAPRGGSGGSPPEVCHGWLPAARRLVLTPFSSVFGRKRVQNGTFWQ